MTAPLVIVCRLVKAAIKQTAIATRPIRRYRPMRRAAKAGTASVASKKAALVWTCAVIGAGGLGVGFWAAGEIDAPIRITPEIGVTNRGSAEIQRTTGFNGFPGNSGLIEVPDEFSALPPDVLASPFPLIEIEIIGPPFAFAAPPDFKPAPQSASETPPEQPTTPVPEPASLALLATAVVAGLWRTRL
jgi:hypothetical protein